MRRHVRKKTTKSATIFHRLMLPSTGQFYFNTVGSMTRRCKDSAFAAAVAAFTADWRMG